MEQIVFGPINIHDPFLATITCITTFIVVMDTSATIIIIDINTTITTFTDTTPPCWHRHGYYIINIVITITTKKYI